MSGFLGLFPAAPPAIATNPLPTVPRTDSERWDLEFESGRLNGRFISRDTALFEAFEAGREAYRQAGVELENPYAGYWWRPSQILQGPTARAHDDIQRQRRLEAWAAAHERLAQGAPEEAARFLSVTELTQRAGARAARAAREAEAAAQVGHGGLGAFFGSAAAVFTDPVQLATLPFGAPWRAAGGIGMRVLETAILEAMIAGGTQAIVETGAAPWRAEAGSPGSIGQNIATAAAGGAILGGGMRALVEGWGAVAGRAARRPAGTLAEHADDMAMLGQAQMRSDLGNAAGPERAAAHQDAFDAAGQAVQQGRIAPGGLPAVDPPAVAAERLVGLSAIEMRAHARDAVEEALARQGGPPAAIYRPDLGAVAIDWGTPGNALRDFRGGEGLANLAAIRAATGQETDAFLRDVLPDLLVTGRTENLRGRGDAMRVDLVLGENSVTLALRRDGTREHWTIAGFATREAAEDAPRLPQGAEPPAARRFRAFTPTGRQVLVEPQVMELRDLIPSHLDDGRVNPAFPHAEGVQPRDRSAAPSRDQVRGIAAGLIPDRLAPNAEAGFGAPIVALDNVVESGNGRILALRSAYNDPTLAAQAEAYRAFLAARGHDLAGFDQPVLVSRRVSALSPEERRAFVQEANSRQTLAASAAERATQDAGRVRQALDLWRGGEVDSAANAPFVRRFLGQLTEAERGDLLTSNGHLTAEGIRRINDAMMAAAYGDVLGPLLRRFLETRNDGLRSVANALGDVAGDWARMRVLAERGEIAAAVDATADLGNALATLDHARRAKLAVRGLLLQADLDRPPLTDAGAAFLAAMFRDPGFAGPQLGRERIAARLQGYIDEAMKTQGGPSLFGDAARPADVMAVGTRNADRAAAEAVPGAAAADQPALMQLDEAAPTFRFDAQPAAPRAEPLLDPELIRRQQILEASRAAEAERAAAQPQAVRSAEVLEAQRIAAREDLAVPNPPEGQVATEGAPTIGARDLLDQAEARVNEAAEAAACLIGGLTA